ncbi:MAG: replication protein [candidate division Zixibacteria bacterium]|nr:replication protein [candidate division Zixibacteria bacterium]
MENPYQKLSAVSPQREDGHRRIANDVYRELLLSDMTASELKVVLYIIDQTWGYSKKSASITVSAMVAATGFTSRMIRKVISLLKARRIIHYERTGALVRGQHLNEFLFNKHYDTWLTRQLFESSPLNSSTVTPEPEGTQLLSESSPPSIIERKKDIERAGESEKAKSPKPKSDHAKAIAYFCDKHLDSTDTPYHFVKGKDGTIVRDLLATYDLEKFRQLVDALFLSDDPFYDKAGRTMGTLKGTVNKLAQSLSESHTVLECY